MRAFRQRARGTRHSLRARLLLGGPVLDYSIPPEAAGRQLTLVASGTPVRILDGAVEMARHTSPAKIGDYLRPKLRQPPPRAESAGYSPENPCPAGAEDLMV